METPRVSDVEAFSLRLTWQTPTQPNGVVVNYNIFQNEVFAGNVHRLCLCLSVRQWRIQRGATPAMPPQSGHGIHCGQLILTKISEIGATRSFKAKMHQIRFPLMLRPRSR